MSMELNIGGRLVGRGRPVYVVAGRTHPRVLENEGERYRHGLRRVSRGVVR